jgi:hypothetical protein
MDKMQHVKDMFAKWITRLGLAWWDIKVVYYDDPADIIDHFSGDDGLSTMICHVDWKYCTASIEVNYAEVVHLDPDEIEHVVVHELIHILVNEMREGELHHEERVVTYLTKAIFWATEAAQRDISKEVKDG